MANIKIERVETIYGTEFYTDDKEKLLKAVTYLKRIGITDIRTFTVEEDTPAQQSIVVKNERQYYLYALLRGDELGYIGLTYMNPPSLRVDQHLKKGKEAAEPYTRWLADGYSQGDIRVQYQKVDGDDTEARRMERLAIRNLKPIFNQKLNTLNAPTVEPPSLFGKLTTE